MTLTTAPFQILIKSSGAEEVELFPRDDSGPFYFCDGELHYLTVRLDTGSASVTVSSIFRQFSNQVITAIAVPLID